MNICLSMIVRNESAVIRRCLRSISPHVTHYAIVDTGSIDATIDIVRSCLKALQGHVRVEEWSDDFSVHRNQALALAKEVLGPAGGKILFMDADEVFVGDLNFLSSRDCDLEDAWQWWVEDGDYRYRKLGVVKSSSALGWIASRHEWLDISQNSRVGFVADGHVKYGHDGARGKDANSLIADLSQLTNESKEPDTARRHFFVARTLEALGRNAEAVKEYELTASLTEASGDEHWQAVWGKARSISAIPDESPKLKAEAYFAAHTANPMRAEPVLALAVLAYQLGQFVEALKMATYARQCRLPQDTAIYDHSAYTWRADELIRELARYRLKTEH